MSAGIGEEGRGGRAREIGRRELGEKRTLTQLSVCAEPLRAAQPPPPIPYGASPRAVSIIQAGLMLNASRSTIYRMIGAKRLRAIKVGADGDRKRGLISALIFELHAGLDVEPPSPSLLVKAEGDAVGLERGQVIAERIGDEEGAFGAHREPA
jgi:excisionase family DNA binding protein